MTAEPLAESGDRTSFVYRIHIESPLETVWAALWDPVHTRRWWGATLTSDWSPGAAVTWSYAGVTVVDPGSIVVAFEPPHRLVYRWHVTTAELARATGMSEEMRLRLDRESRSTADFRLEQGEGAVKLTLTQSGFDLGSAKLTSLVESWPRVLSRLKSYLERDQR